MFPRMIKAPDGAAYAWNELRNPTAADYASLQRFREWKRTGGQPPQDVDPTLWLGRRRGYLKDRLNREGNDPRIVREIRDIDRWTTKIAINGAGPEGLFESDAENLWTRDGDFAPD